MGRFRRRRDRERKSPSPASDLNRRGAAQRARASEAAPAGKRPGRGTGCGDTRFAATRRSPARVAELSRIATAPRRGHQVHPAHSAASLVEIVTDRPSGENSAPALSRAARIFCTVLFRTSCPCSNRKTVLRLTRAYVASCRADKSRPARAMRHSNGVMSDHPGVWSKRIPLRPYPF